MYNINWWDFTDAQADLSLSWVHMSEGTVSHVEGHYKEIN